MSFGYDDGKNPPEDGDFWDGEDWETEERPSRKPVRRTEQPGYDAAGGRAGSRTGGRAGTRRTAFQQGKQRNPYSQTGTTASHSSRYAQLKEEQARKKKKRRRIIAMIVAECLVLTAIFSYAYVTRLWNLMPRPTVREENVTNPNLAVEDIHKMQGYWMVAIFGIDVGTGASGARGNSSDVNIIACINQDTGEIKLVSLYRDTYLKVTDKGEYRKFNYAYSAGGPEMALKMLNENLDLNITEYITFNWKAVADGINILGGVDVDITKSEFKYINSFITETVKETGVGSYQLKSAGMNHLDGIQAVSYARLRLMDNDYKRTERQRKIIQLAFDKAKQSNYSVLNNILVVCLPQVMTNLEFADLTNLALGISKYHIGETVGFPFDKGDANMGSKGASVIPLSLESNVSQLHQFLFGDEAYTPTSTVRQISQKIASDTGLYANKSSSSGGSSGGQSSEGKKETKDSEKETEENEDGPDSSSADRTVPVYPGIFETDEDGNLIDPPEPDEPFLPGGTTRPGPTESSPAPSPGMNETQPGYVPYGPGYETQPQDGNEPRWPGDTGSENGGPGDAGTPSGGTGGPGDMSVGPGSTGTGPGLSEGNTGGPGAAENGPGAGTGDSGSLQGGPGVSAGPGDSSGVITGPGDVAPGPGY